MLSIISAALLLTAFAASANAQVTQQGFPRNRGIAGGAIAGAIIAAIAGILLFCMIYMMVVRARRRQPLLPGPNGGFIRVNRPPETATVPGVGYNYNNTSAYNNEGPYQPPAGDPPEQQAPPPYPGKETYPGQQSAAAAPNAPQPGGFASPPGPPPAAHVNNASPRNNRFGWFKAN